MPENHNRGFQGPAFNRSGRRRLSVVPDDELVVESGFLNNRSNISTFTERSNNSRRSRLLNVNGRSVGNQSNISCTSVGDCASSIRSGSYRIQEEHDPNRKPHRKHGAETIGDLLSHPLKEYQLHQKRVEAYEAEMASWNEKHPEPINSTKDVDDIVDESTA